MPNTSTLRTGVTKTHILIVFVMAELMLLTAFTILLLEGQQKLALVSLVASLSVALLGVLFRDDYYVLLFFSLLCPLMILQFLPPLLYDYALYPVVVTLLLVSRLAWFVESDPLRFGRLSPHEVVPGQLLLVSLVVSLVVAFVRGDGNAHTSKYTVLMLEFVTMSYFFAVVPRSARQVRTLLLAICVPVVAVSAMLPFLGVASRVGSLGLAGSKIVVGPFWRFDLNTLGGLIAIASAVLVGFGATARRNRTRILMLAAVSVLLLALVTTRSRGAWLGFGVALVFVVLWTRSAWAVALIVAASAVLLASDVLRETVTTRLMQTSSEDASLAGRAVLWSSAVGMIRDHWVTGVGFENFRVLKIQYGFPNLGMSEVMRYNAHNIYLEMFADLGIVGVVAFLWLLVGTILTTVRIASGSDSSRSGLAVAISAGLVAFAVHGVWDCLITLFMVPGALLGLAMCLRRLDSDASDGRVVRCA